MEQPGLPVADLGLHMGPLGVQMTRSWAGTAAAAADKAEERNEADIAEEDIAEPGRSGLVVGLHLAVLEAAFVALELELETVGIVVGLPRLAEDVEQDIGSVGSGRDEQESPPDLV